MIVNKSFKYDSDKFPKVDEWVQRQTVFSDAIRKLIEKECGVTDPVLDELKQIRQQLSGLRLSGPVTPRLESELIQIEETLGQIEERQEVKEVDAKQLKSRYGL
jgi:hypothetical protein